ncbi:hypothetical protein [Iodobacter ciconiae]|uniref:Uncharacterized protein n=1 Tax=Iodobacter ciconiae TaxID=2496266 RepID=A0A3S8ZPG0_9NEIS|nr:hypothetical protein [Iodobacter ciconiae]AZN35343.1 hypothetical protein EJO50_01855 [Iodobacter ciconiae]
MKDINKVLVGQEVVLPARPVSRKPEQGLIADVLCALGLDYADEHALEYVRSHVVQPKGGIIQANYSAQEDCKTSDLKATAQRNANIERKACT